MSMQTLKEFEEWYEPTLEYTRNVHETFCRLVNQDPKLKAHRDFVEQHVYGFGERSFHWMWKLLIEDFGNTCFKFLEIGVYKGQVLSLVRMLGGDFADIYGITPLDTSGGMTDRDYLQDIKDLHNQFDLKFNEKNLLIGKSQESHIWKQTRDITDKIGKFDIIYIDGGHAYEEALEDIASYSELLKVGGYLVVDDCANDIPHPFGYFMGIQDVTNAVKQLLPDVENDEYKFVGSVVHNKIWRKK